MDENDFEGTLVLEQLASMDLVEDFFEAVDSDDIDLAVSLMKKAGVEAEIISMVIKKMSNPE